MSTNAADLLVGLEPERLARAYLVRVAEPPAPGLVAFAGHHGPIIAAERVRAGDCPPRVRAETSARRDQDFAERDLAEAAAVGARLVIPEDDEWPAWPLLSLTVATGRGVPGVAPPLALWVRGERRLDELATGAVAMVGARAASGYGEHTAAEFAYGLTSRDMPVFSGAAYGIDGAAHRGALAAEGLTAAVLACGIDIAYPSGHTALLERIAARGLVLSEYPPQTRPARHRFLVRNRLIAALTEGTVVVEAGKRSGARNTATTAGTVGKVVMAVPGPISSASSVGCNQLIRDCSATLVASVDDVVETVGKFGTPRQELAGPRTRTDGLSPEALRLHEALGRQGKSAEWLATESGVGLTKVRALLPALELSGLSERCERGWRSSEPADVCSGITPGQEIPR